MRWPHVLRRPRFGPKVFGIGLNRTGTTSLSRALRLLGYAHAPYAPQLIEPAVRGDRRALARFARRYDSFEDWPWPLVFRWLDRQFPGSKFVLTRRRTPEAWLKSLSQHCQDRPLVTPPERVNFVHQPVITPNEQHRLALGFEYPELAPEELLGHYRHHNATVRHYFRDRPGDLLEVCWEEGHGWPELCAFLGKRIPADLAFPNVGAAERRAVDPAVQAANRARLEELRGTPTGP